MDRRRLQPILLLFLTLVSASWAAEKLGTASSSGEFELRGARVPASAARSLPLLNGDAVRTRGSTALLELDDSSRVAVDENSFLTILQSGNETTVCLQEGALRLRSAEGRPVVVCALGRRLELQPAAEGAVSIKNGEQVLADGVEDGVFRVDDAACSCDPRLSKRSKLPVVVLGAGGVASVISIAAAAGDAADPPLRSISRSRP